MNERLQATTKQLELLGVVHRVIDLGGTAVRTRDVIAHRGLNISHDEIVKTILFKAKKQGVFAVAVCGADRISYHKLRDVLGEKKISTLRPEQMRELGWEPGECCPLTVPGPLFVDPAVLALEKINTGSGDLHFGLEFS